MAIIGCDGFRDVEIPISKVVTAKNGWPHVEVQGGHFGISHDNGTFGTFLQTPCSQYNNTLTLHLEPRLNYDGLNIYRNELIHDLPYFVVCYASKEYAIQESSV